MTAETSHHFNNNLEHILAKGRTAQYFYVEAHQHLHDLIEEAVHGNEIDQGDLEDISRRLKTTKENAVVSGDHLFSFKAEMTDIFVPLMIYSDVINVSPLSRAEAQNVRKKFDFLGIKQRLSYVARDSLRLYDELDAIPKHDRTDDQTYLYQDLRGLLSEQTSLLLLNRHATPKRYAVPAPYYDDALDPKRACRKDLILYDNQTTRSHSKYFAQVKSSTSYSRSDPSVATIHAYDLGNLPRLSLWHHSNRGFLTLRSLIHEGVHGEVKPEYSWVLDRIHSHVLHKITKKP